MLGKVSKVFLLCIRCNVLGCVVRGVAECSVLMYDGWCDDAQGNCVMSIGMVFMLLTYVT